MAVAVSGCGAVDEAIRPGRASGHRGAEHRIKQPELKIDALLSPLILAQIITALIIGRPLDVGSSIGGVCCCTQGGVGFTLVFPHSRR